MSSSDNQFRESRLKKLHHLEEKGINPYPYNFKRTHSAKELHTHYEGLEKGVTSQDKTSIAGRIMAIRNSGMFIDLHDISGKVQVFSTEKTLSPEGMSLLNELDLGDIIGVRGIIRRTPRGELTIDAIDIEILSKALLPLPEKYHGLTDLETRYRQRYLDLIMNEESRDTLRKRSQVITAIRTYLIGEGFLEVETPMLHVIPGGASAKPFVTHHNTLDMKMYLRIAPELFLKKLIVGGLSEKVFEMNRCFRNEGISPRHNPEFTTVELYQAYADYQDMMNLTEDLVAYICETVLKTTEISYGSHVLSFKKPWPRKSMLSLVEEETGINFLKVTSDQEARTIARSLNIAVKETDGWGKVIEAIFGEKVEHKLIQPIHVIDFPREISPLAKVHRDDPRLTERFESYVNTWEIANAFSELTDPLDQRERFEAQMREREAGDSEAQMLDQDFVTALEYGCPPTGGLGIGIDRLVMILTNSSSIRDVIAFPTMRLKE